MSRKKHKPVQRLIQADAGNAKNRKRGDDNAKEQIRSRKSGKYICPKMEQIRSEAADLGITPEEHLIRQAEKELTDLKKKYATSLNKSQQIAALNWTVEKANTTYGKLVSSLSPADKAEIYHQYEDYLVEQQKIEEEKAKELRAIARKI